jgi:MFS family permease
LYSESHKKSFSVTIAKRLIAGRVVAGGLANLLRRHFRFRVTQTQCGKLFVAIDCTMLRHLSRDLFVTDWSQSRAVSSLPCTPAIAITLLGGLAIGNPIAGMIAASGAMSVGFGAFQRLGRSRVMPMPWATVGMTLCTAAGSVAMHSAIALAVAAAIIGLLYGLATAISGGTAWVALQCAIFAIVASGYPANPRQVLERALLILIGGLLQLLLVTFFRRIHIGFAAGVPPDTFGGVRPSLRKLREALSWRSRDFRYAITLAAMLTVTASLARYLRLANDYWVPMTALLVLRTDLHETLTRGFARMAGTIFGAGIATLLVSLTRPGPVALVFLIVLFAWLSYSTVMVSYGTLSASVTAYIACLLAFGGLPETGVALHRIGQLNARAGKLMWQMGC